MVILEITSLLSNRFRFCRGTLFFLPVFLPSFRRTPIVAITLCSPPTDFWRDGGCARSHDACLLSLSTTAPLLLLTAEGAVVPSPSLHCRGLFLDY